MPRYISKSALNLEKKVGSTSKNWEDSIQEVGDKKSKEIEKSKQEVSTKKEKIEYEKANKKEKKKAQEMEIKLPKF